MNSPWRDNRPVFEQTPAENHKEQIRAFVRPFAMRENRDVGYRPPTDVLPAWTVGARSHEYGRDGGPPAAKRGAIRRLPTS